jgi:hypothetical protein
MNPARPPGGFPLFGNYTADKLLPKNTCLTEPLELEPVRFQRPYFGRPLCSFSPSPGVPLSERLPVMVTRPLRGRLLLRMIMLQKAVTLNEGDRGCAGGE